MQFDPSNFLVHSFPQEVTISARGSLAFDVRSVTKHGLGVKWKAAQLLSDGQGTVAIELMERAPKEPGDLVIYDIHSFEPRGGGKTARIHIRKFMDSLDYSPRQKYRAAYTVEESGDRRFVVFKLPRFGVDKLSTRTVSESVEADDDDIELTDKMLDEEIEHYFGSKGNVKFEEASGYIRQLDASVTPERLKKRMQAVGVKDIGSGWWRMEKKGGKS